MVGYVVRVQFEWIRSYCRVELYQCHQNLAINNVRRASLPLFNAIKSKRVFPESTPYAIAKGLMFLGLIVLCFAEPTHLWENVKYIPYTRKSRVSNAQIPLGS